MDMTELIRNANSAAEVFSALSAYVLTLRHVSAIPDWCQRLPIRGAEDVRARTLALVTVVNLTSQHLRDEDCNVAKRALRVFAAACWRLRPRARDR